eukprot:s4054_g2.t1
MPATRSWTVRSGSCSTIGRLSRIGSTMAISSSTPEAARGPTRSAALGGLLIPMPIAPKTPRLRPVVAHGRAAFETFFISLETKMEQQNELAKVQQPLDGLRPAQPHTEHQGFTRPGKHGKPSSYESLEQLLTPTWRSSTDLGTATPGATERATGSRGRAPVVTPARERSVRGTPRTAGESESPPATPGTSLWAKAQKAKVLLAMPKKPSTAPAAPNGRLGSIRPNLRRNALKVEQLQEETTGLNFLGG